MQNKILSLLVDNTSGVLSRIAGMFSRRGYNIDSITAGVTADVNYTRITVVCSGDDAILDQIVALDTSISTLKLQQAEMDRKFTPQHPAYRALMGQLAELTAKPAV